MRTSSRSEPLSCRPLTTTDQHTSAPHGRTTAARQHECLFESSSCFVKLSSIDVGFVKAQKRSTKTCPGDDRHDDWLTTVAVEIGTHRVCGETELNEYTAVIIEKGNLATETKDIVPMDEEEQEPSFHHKTFVCWWWLS